MPPLKRHVRRVIAAAAVPAGIVAAFVFIPVARAAPGRPAAQAARAAAIQSTRPGQSLAHSTATRHRRARHRRAGRLRAYAWAATQAGHPYVWGGTGPGYDCSGLVMMAYRHVGIDLPRTTYEMLASRLLVRIWHPRMGDLAFYGSGHVELFRRWGYTYGAHDWGSPVGLIRYGRGWRPTAFYRVR